MQVFSRKSNGGGSKVIPSVKYPASPVARLYLIIGQSNAAGTEPVVNFSPEYQQARERTYVVINNNQWVLLQPGVNNRNGSIAGFDITASLELEKAYPNDTIYLLNLSWGSTSLVNDWDTLRGFYLATELVQLFRAIRTLPGNAVWSGILWNQGEADNDGGVNASSYKKRLTRLIELHRNLFGHQIPFIASRLYQAGNVRTAVEQLKQENYPYFDWIDQDGFTMKDGGVHFLADGYTEIGKRYAQKLVAFNAAEPVDRERGIRLIHQDGDQTSDTFSIEIDLPHTGTIWRLNLGTYVVSGTGNVDISVFLVNQSGALTQLLAAQSYAGGDSRVTEVEQTIRRRDFIKLIVSFSRTSGDLAYQPFAAVQIQQAIAGETRSVDRTIQAIEKEAGTGIFKRLATGLTSMVNSSTFGESILSAIDAAAARTQLGFTSTGDALATAADQTTARTALGLGSIATQNSSNASITGGSATGLSSVTVTGSTASVNPQTGAVVVSGGLGVGGEIYTTGIDLSNGGAKNLYLSGDYFHHPTDVSLAVAPLFDRLTGLDVSRITSFGVTLPERSVDFSGDLNALFTANAVGWIEYDFTHLVPTGFDFINGTLLVSWFSGNLPTQAVIEYFGKPTIGGTEGWYTVTTLATFALRKPNLVLLANGPRDIKKLRITVTSGATPARLAFFGYYPSRPNIFKGDAPQYLVRQGQSGQIAYCPSISVSNPSGGGISTLGQGTMSANALPSYADHTAANAALTKGAYYQLIGDPTLYAKP